MEEPVEIELTKAQKIRIEKNRQKAIVLRQTRLVPHQFAKDKMVAVEKTTIKIGSTKYKVTGGGFLLEEEPNNTDEFENIVCEASPIIEYDKPECEKCKERFATSYLFETFDYPICDGCRNDEEHDLITKTDAKKEYLLKDCDLDKREPVLKFITRKNPHNSNWGQMKLYLKIQIEKRALEIWGSEENLMEEIEQRDEKKVVAKAKKYHKEMVNLRKMVRSSLYDKTSSASHKHAFGPEKYNEVEDNYTRICQTCGFVEEFEKM